MAVIVTPGNTAPLSSVTRPFIWAVASCAQARAQVASSSNTTSVKRRDDCFITSSSYLACPRHAAQDGANNTPEACGRQRSETSIECGFRDSLDRAVDDLDVTRGLRRPRS